MVQKRATIKDIAEQAGVSGTTVSRYLNGKFNYMSEETKKRIEIVIDELGYRPSNIARTLKSNKSKLVGAVIADIENPFSNKIIKGLTDKANELGYSLMISVSNNSVEKENESIARFLDNQVDGLIINTVGENEPTLKKIQKQIPLVLIDRDVTSFKADEEIAAYYHQLGVKVVVIKNGSHGALVQEVNKSMQVVAGYKVEKVIDTVGTGDGFAVGIISGYLDGLPLEEAAKRANAIGSLQVQNIGDNEGLPTRDELQAYMEERLLSGVL